MERYFGINYELSQAKIYERIDETLAADGKGYVCVVDGIVLTQTYRDPAYSDVVNHSLFSIMDSSWVPLFVRWIHHKQIQYYHGPQMFLDAVRMQKYRMYFLGADQTLLDALRQNLLQYDPRVAEMQFRELPFCAVEDFDYAAIAEDINRDAPDIIWVALGAPKQERFMSLLLPHLQRGVMVAVGAAFKFHSGLSGQERAPEWLCKMNMEFVFRLFQEPKKQGKRVWGYLTALPAMLWDEWRLHRLQQQQGKGLTMLMRRFVELVRCGATGERPDTRLFQGTVPWPTLMHMAERQMLTGIAFDGIRLLPAELAPPRDLLMKWLLKAEKIHKMNELMDVRSAEAEAHFQQRGFSCCILKGQGLARLYAHPTSRTPGDIDIWVKGDRKELIDMATALKPDVEPTYHHIDYALFNDTEMELHYMPTWMYSPLKNRRLQRFFREEARWDVMAPGGGFHVPPQRLDLVFVLVHIYRHFFTEGIGMRQLLDYYCVLRSCHDADERRQVMQVLRQLGMARFTAATMWLLGKCFCLDGEHMLCSPDEPEGRFLLIEVMKAGNFGQYDARIKSSANETEWHLFIRKTKRNFHFLIRYPSEVLWSPFWKLWHWIWRKTNK